MAKITLYSEPNFGGNSQVFTGSVSDLDEVSLGNDNDWNDEAASCKVESGVWELYKDTDYDGGRAIVTPGEYANFEDLYGIESNSSVSSLRPLVAPSGVKITLFSETEFRGHSKEIFYEVDRLEAIEMADGRDWNDEAGSCKVEQGTWLLYNGEDFSHDSAILPEGDYPNLGDLGGIHSNRALSSLRPLLPHRGEKPLITLFGDTDYCGTWRIATETVNDLGDFTDEASSVIVSGGTWRLFRDKNGTGEEWEVSAKGGPAADGRYPESSNAFGNDAVESLEPGVPKDLRAWMQHLDPLKRLVDSYIPTSHDSGSYEEHGVGWVGDLAGSVTQAGNFYHQLKVGARYFDTRLKKSLLGHGIVLHHSLVEGARFADVLPDQIVKYSNEFPSEIIFLDLDIDGAIEDDVAEMIEQHIPKDLIATEYFDSATGAFKPDVTWGDLVRNGRRFVITWSKPRSEQYPWISNRDQIRNSPYDHFNKKSVDEILEYLDWCVKDWKKDKLFIAQVLDTPGVSPFEHPAWLERKHGAELNAWVRTNGPKLNCVMRDFVDWYPDLMAYIVGLNGSR